MHAEFSLTLLILVICIRNMIMQIDQFSPKFVVACKTIQCISVLNLKFFGSMKTELWAEKVGEFSIMLHGKMGWWTYVCPPTWLPQYRDFLNFEHLQVIQIETSYDSCPIIFGLPTKFPGPSSCISCSCFGSLIF